MTVLSERMGELMRRQKLTQKELAAKAGVTESAMSYYVNGERTPRSDILAKIAASLETSTDYLLGTTDNPYPDTASKDLQYLQRNLSKLDEEQLKKAENILKAVFEDIFYDEEEE